MADLSYVSVPMSEPYIYQSVPERLRVLAEQDPDREAFVFYDMKKQRSHLTRKEVWDKAVHIAKILVSMGLKKGSHVAFCMNNSMEMLLGNFGAMCAGGIPFYFGNFLKDGSDVIETINEMKADILFLDANPTTEQLIERIRCGIQDGSNNFPTLKYVIINGELPVETSTCFTFATLQNKKLEERSNRLPEVQPEYVMSYFCTSGSTGKPKMVEYTHFNILNWTKQSNNRFEITEKSRFFCDRTFGWVVGFPRTYLTEGATRVFVDMKMTVAGNDIEFVCKLIERERCDVVYLPGYIMADLKENVGLAEHFSGVRTMIAAGERVSNIVTSMPGTFCKRLCAWYGNTECGGVSVFVVTPETTNDFEEGIIGKPIPGTEIKITDDNGHVVPIGQSGQLTIRCNWRLTGYRGMEERFRQDVDVMNWFHAGDIVHMRENGEIIVEGRRNELISIGTSKVFPWAIEKTLKTFTGAASIFAVGVPDKRLFQVICACAVPKEGQPLKPSDVERFCENKFNNESIIIGIGLKPQYYLVLDSVPLTPSGKVDRRSIGLIAKEKLGL